MFSKTFRFVMWPNQAVVRDNLFKVNAPSQSDGHNAPMTIDGKLTLGQAGRCFIPLLSGARGTTRGKPVRGTSGVCVLYRMCTREGCLPGGSEQWARAPVYGSMSACEMSIIISVHYHQLSTSRGGVCLCSGKCTVVAAIATVLFTGHG